MKRLVTIDYNGTIVDPRYLDYFWLELIPREVSSARGLGLEEGRRMVVREYERVGPGDIRWYLPGYWASLFKIDHEVLRELYEEAAEKTVVYGDALEFYEVVKDVCKIAVVTNAAEELVEPVLRKYSIKADLVFCTPNRMGEFVKTPRAYSMVLGTVGVGAGEAMHFGDDLLQDFYYPMRAGIESYLIDRSGAGGPVSIRSLREAVDLVLSG